MNAFRVEEYPYLIIGGAPKAGTTSLYKWLADHPKVCASSIKETRFFLDADYPLPSATRFNGTNLEEYDGFFRHCRDAENLVRVDASPDYLYSKAALRIAELLPRAKLVFILRDPVERMVSWYKYARQRGLIGKKMTLREYIIIQVVNPVTTETPIHLRALDQCRHEKYLQPFREVFGKRCMVLNFDDIKTDPRGFMARVCGFSGLDESFYDSYTFQAENVSQDVRIGFVMKGYTKIRRGLALRLHDNPLLFSLMRIPNGYIKKILSFNTKTANRVEVTDELGDLISRQSSH